MGIDNLLNGVDIIKIEGNVDEIAGITDNSREVSHNYLFAALRGEKLDGHDFINEAIKNDAAILLVEEEPKEEFPYIRVPNSRKAFAKIVSNYYGNPSEKMKIIGITGTNGKTTTSILLSSIYKDSIYFSTIKYLTSEGEMKSINTTPSPLIIQKELHNAINKGIETAIIEVSSHGIVQDRIYSIDFDYGIFMNISRDHLDYHKTFEAYREAKLRFFKSLDSDKMAIINVDDTNAPYFIKNTESKVITFGLKKGNIQGEIIENTFDNLILKIEGMDRNLKIESPLIGTYNAYNILASASVAIMDNIEDEQIIDGIQKVKVLPGRMEKVDVSKPISIVVDYAHTPEALSSVISSIKNFNINKLITVFGAGGERDRGKRAIMGMVSSKLSDIVIVTSDNPRSEDPEKIIDNIFEGIDGGEVYRIVDRKEAIFKALDVAREGDLVLIAGKGHEDYQEIKGKRIPFSDKDCVREYFRR